MLRLNELTYQLSELSAESRLALIAKRAGMEVKIGESPDLLIDGVGIEVKFDRRDKMDLGAFANKVKAGLSLEGSILAIRMGDFSNKKINGLKIR